MSEYYSALHAIYQSVNQWAHTFYVIMTPFFIGASILLLLARQWLLLKRFQWCVTQLVRSLRPPGIVVCGMIWRWKIGVILSKIVINSSMRAKGFVLSNKTWQTGIKDISPTYLLLFVCSYINDIESVYRLSIGFYSLLRISTEVSLNVNYCCKVDI